MKKLINFICIGILLFSTLTASQIPGPVQNLTMSAEKIFDGVIYKTTKPVTVGWDAVSGATFYEYYVLMFDKKPHTKFLEGTTSEIQHTFEKPRTGLFEAYVRACSEAPPENCNDISPCCSRWSRSGDKRDAVVDGLPKEWAILWKPEPPITYTP